MDVTYGSNIQAAMEDPNGTPGQTRGAVPPTISRPPITPYELNGSGPSPYAQNSTNPNPLDEAQFPPPAVGPEG